MPFILSRKHAAVLSSTLNLTRSFAVDSYELPSAEDTYRAAQCASQCNWRVSVSRYTDIYPTRPDPTRGL